MPEPEPGRTDLGYATPYAQWRPIVATMHRATLIAALQCGPQAARPPSLGSLRLADLRAAVVLVLRGGGSAADAMAGALRQAQRNADFAQMVRRTGR